MLCCLTPGFLLTYLPDYYSFALTNSKKQNERYFFFTSWVSARSISRSPLVLSRSVYPVFFLITLFLEELPQRFITTAASSRNYSIPNLTAYPKSCSHSRGYPASRGPGWLLRRTFYVITLRRKRHLMKLSFHYKNARSERSETNFGERYWLILLESHNNGGCFHSWKNYNGRSGGRYISAQTMHLAGMVRCFVMYWSRLMYQVACVGRRGEFWGNRCWYEVGTEKLKSLKES